MMKLENWSLVPASADPYQAPELAGVRVHGQVYNNPKFLDGEEVTTSRVVEVQTDEDKLGVVTKSGSFYELGEPSAEYEALFPGARKRLAACVGKEF